MGGSAARHPLICRNSRSQGAGHAFATVPPPRWCRRQTTSLGVGDDEAHVVEAAEAAVEGCDGARPGARDGGDVGVGYEIRGRIRLEAHRPELVEALGETVDMAAISGSAAHGVDEGERLAQRRGTTNTRGLVTSRTKPTQTGSGTSTGTPLSIR